MPPALALAAVGTAIAAVGTVAQMSAASKQAKAAKAANRFERQKNELQSARQKMEAVREGRRSAAVASQNAENQGVAGSSIGQGGVGSIISQTNSNLSFLDRYGYFSDQASKNLQKAANYGAKGEMWGAIAGIGEKIASTGSFTGPKPPAGAK